jgi:hypothetical protein
MLSWHNHEQRTPITSIPDALLARIANLAIADLRRARSNYVRRREIAEQELNESVGRLNGNEYIFPKKANIKKTSPISKYGSATPSRRRARLHPMLRLVAR